MRITGGKDGFTMIELVVAMTLLALGVALSVSAINYGDRAKNDVANELMSKFTTIEGAFNLYYADKSTYPATGTGKQGFNDTAFVPIYLYPPPAAKLFLGTFAADGAETGGTYGFQLGLKTTGSAPDRGYYVCAKAEDTTVSSTAGSEDTVFLAVKDVVKTKLSSNKVYYGTSCPVVEDTAPGGSTLYVTYWLTRY